MSIDFSANQYENAFLPHKMQNWQRDKGQTKQPEDQEGFTTIIANDRGHLLPCQPRSRTSPWGTFVGTWDMPDRLPVPWKINVTARSEEAVDKLESNKFEKDVVLAGKLKQCKVPPPLKPLQNVVNTKKGMQKDAVHSDSTLRSGAKAPLPMTECSDACANGAPSSPDKSIKDKTSSTPDRSANANAGEMTPEPSANAASPEKPLNIASREKLSPASQRGGIASPIEKSPLSPNQNANAIPSDQNANTSPTKMSTQTKVEWPLPKSLTGAKE